MPTIADVAKACGMSKATVSLVINNSPMKVSKETRAKVMLVVREMNYQPSAHAQSLSRQRSNMIGIVTVRKAHLLGDPYFGTLIDSIVDCAAEMDQTVALYNGRIWKDEAKTGTVFSDGRCDGLLLVMSYHDVELTEALQKARIQFIAVNSSVASENVNSIDIDNVDAGYQMTRYLFGLGHRRIACLRTNDPYSIERFAGYKKALVDVGVAFDTRLDFIGHYTQDVSGYVRAQQMVSQPSLGITAIFCATDGLAVDAIAGLKDTGLRVPDDISVVGINDTPDAARCNPPLTTLRQSVESIGAEALHRLMDLIRQPNQDARQIICPTQLIERKSAVPSASIVNSPHA